MTRGGGSGAGCATGAGGGGGGAQLAASAAPPATPTTAAAFVRSLRRDNFSAISEIRSSHGWCRRTTAGSESSGFCCSSESGLAAGRNARRQGGEPLAQFG